MAIFVVVFLSLGLIGTMLCLASLILDTIGIDTLESLGRAGMIIVLMTLCLLLLAWLVITILKIWALL